MTNCMTLITALLALLGAHSGRAQAPWQPQPAPLMTRWADEVNPGNIHRAYPRPQMARAAWMNLNGVWQFEMAEGADDEPPIGRPLSRSIMVPFPVESALSGVMERAERMWYRRTFEVPAPWLEDRIARRMLLHFEAVDFEARVWVNGTAMGTHRGGYDRFTFDITDALVEEGANEIVVGVWDPTDGGEQPRGKQVREPKGIWYTPASGIWQTVWLEPVPQSIAPRPDLKRMRPTYIRSVTATPDVANSAVRIRTRIWHSSHDIHPELKPIIPSVEAVVLDGDTVLTHSRGLFGADVTLTIPEPKLWTPENPFLYRLQVSLVSNAFHRGPVFPDMVECYFAMRSIEVGPDADGTMRLLLNGEPVFHIGTLDQGYWPDGIYTAPTDEALRHDLEMTKKLGFNAIRKHVKIEPDRWYYWCDKLGMLVWQDMPSGDAFVKPGQGEIERSEESARQFEQELKRLIEGRGNHPCIVMWVLFNEGWGQYDTKRLTEWLKRADPTRLVNAASGWNDLDVGDVHDVHSYPGPAAPPMEPTRAAVLGEFGGLGLGVDGHTWAEKTWGYRGTADSEELTRRYEQLMRGVWELKEQAGLAAAIYTQITDVETECNGLLTYDRAVCKVDGDRVAAANRGRLPRLEIAVPTAKDDAVRWRYATEAPPPEWFQPGFDDTAWRVGTAGFGREGTPGAVVRTAWTDDEIWLRREVELASPLSADIMLYVHHDEDAEVYINGVLAATLTGYTTTYEAVPLGADARAALGPGRNVIAVHCRQTTGGQYIDVGFVRPAEPEPTRTGDAESNTPKASEDTNG